MAGGLLLRFCALALAAGASSTPAAGSTHTASSGKLGDQGTCSEHSLIQQSLAPAGKRPSTAPGGRGGRQPVTLRRTTHTLYYVQDPSFIGNPKQVSRRDVPAWELGNDRGIRVKIIREGATVVELLKDGVNYLWDNSEGAAYNGAKTGTFPLTRGLVLHGGIRYAVVAAEHGLYYDATWNISFPDSPDGTSRSVVLSIVDTAEQRAKLNDTTSASGFSYDGSEEPMQRYPVSNLNFSLTVTLRAGEDFVRLRPAVENPTDQPAGSEAWLSTTFPIDEASRIISPQRYVFRRDDWCFRDLPNIVALDSREWLRYPLRWPEMCIFYDYPSQDGDYHASTIAPASQGRGAAYVQLGSTTGLHFTKYWSWGVRDPEVQWSSGRPAGEYYEPWFSAFNSHFFQTFEFPARSTSSWEGVVVPLDGGLAGENGTLQRGKVEELLASMGFPSAGQRPPLGLLSH